VGGGLAVLVESLQSCRAHDLHDRERRSNAATLGDLPRHDPAACLLLGAIQQQREQWDASNQNCRAALQLLAAPKQLNRESPTEALKIQAYDGLLTNCYQQRHFAEAESILFEALQVAPHEAAFLHFRLGQHYRLAGRPLDAERHLTKAIELSPNYQQQVDNELTDIHQGMSGCLFPSAGGIRSQASLSH
jgi:tetratricopeptide (TPR) repeat protein